MKNLQRLVKEVLEDCEKLGITTYAKDISWETSNRLQRAYGKAIHRYDGYTIKIATFLLEDSLDDMAVKNTIMHEILHTCPNCMTHKGEWKRLADYVNAHSDYHITRTTARSEKGLPPRQMSPYKYAVNCEKCGCVAKRRKSSRLIQHPDYFRCGKCHGKLYIVTL